MWRKILILCLFPCMAVIATAFAAPAIGDITQSVQAAQQGKALSNRADGQRRVALVIGNESYADEPLGNARNDARAMNDALLSLGFEVIRQEDTDAQRMQQALAEFEHRLRDGGVGLFYFAGHGLQLAGKTLLLPIDADWRYPASLVTRGIDLHAVLAAMSTPRPHRLNLLILDTCLNNPFTGFVDVAGLAALPEQTLVAHATAPGSVAMEGERHGVYTEALTEAIAHARKNAFGSASMFDLFERAAAHVRHITGGRQLPWIASSLPAPSAAHDLFTPPADAARDIMLAGRNRGVMPKDSAEQYELTFWESIKDSTHASDYEAYLQAYPNGRFAALARARVERLRASAPKAQTPPAQSPVQSAPATRAVPERARPAPAAKPAPERAKAAPPSAPSAPPAQPPAASAGAPAPNEQPMANAPPAKGEIKDCAACPVLISLPAGSFTMGSNSSDASEKPAHAVTSKTPFAIGKYEVTVEQWKACIDAGECQQVTNDGNRAGNTPVRDVSWDDAQRYVKWLTKVSGHPYRLPAEAEWEYAARGGTSTRYWWGDQMRKGNANCKECGEPWQQDGPVKAGSFAANPYGLHDTSGSVWEWVQDCWHNSFKGAPADSHAWEEANCRVRVIRGGSWREGASYMPSTTRFKYDAAVRQSQNGFRVARDMK